MNIKTNLIKDYVDYADRSLREHANFVHTTKKQNIYFILIIILFTIITSIFIFSFI